MPQRPREPAHWNLVKEVVATMSVPVIANGDIFRHADFQVGGGNLHEASLFERAPT